MHGPPVTSAARVDCDVQRPLRRTQVCTSVTPQAAPRQVIKLHGNIRGTAAAPAVSDKHT